MDSTSFATSRPEELKMLGLSTKESLSSRDCFGSRLLQQWNSLPARGKGGLVSRALRSHNLWLAVGYVGLLVLMARTYA